MSQRYRALERQFWLAYALAGVAAVGAWVTAARFQEARTVRLEARVTEALLDQCLNLPAALKNFDQQAQRYLDSGTTADLLSYRAAQQAWARASVPVWDGVRRDADAFKHFRLAMADVQRWQDRTVEAKLAGGPVSPIGASLLASAQGHLQELIAAEKALYANRLDRRTAPTTDFFLYGLGTLLAMAGSGLVVRRLMVRDHFMPLEQLALSAADLVEGEGIVPPPDRGGAEIESLAYHVHQLGLRYLGSRHDLHQYQNQLESLAELAGLRQSGGGADLMTVLAEHAARQLEARAAAVVRKAGATYRLAGAYGQDVAALEPYLPALAQALDAARGPLVWVEAGAFPAELQAPLTSQRCHALIAVPVREGDRQAGMIVVWHGAGRAWPEPQPTYLQALAGLVPGTAQADAKPVLPLRRTVAEAIATARDGKQRQWALEQALDEALRACPGAIVELLLLQPDGRTLAVAAARGLPAAEWPGSRLTVGEGFVALAEDQGPWALLTDVGTRMHLIPNPYVRHWQPQAMACAPLPRLGDVRGAIVLYGRRPEALAEAEGVLVSLAGQISLGLRAAQADVLALEAAHDWDLALDLDSRLQSAGDVQAVCRAWVAVAQEAFSAEQGAIYLQGADGVMLPLTSFGHPAMAILDPTSCLALHSGEACGKGGPCSGCEGHGALPGHLCLPMSWRGTRIGLVHLGGLPEHYWTAARTRLAEVLAGKLAAAIGSQLPQAKLS